MSRKMYPFVRRIQLFMFICILINVLQCTSLQTTGTGGTGSETVIGKITHEDGTGAALTVVTLYPFDFDPSSGVERYSFCTDTTDSEGNYSVTITSSNIKKYTLQAINLQRGTRAIVPHIEISAPGDLNLISSVSLCKTGSIRVILPGKAIDAKGYAYIPGTAYFSYLVNGCAIIDSVPAETIPRVCYNDSSNVPQTLSENIDVRSGVAAVVGANGSAHFMKIVLNTTPEGADIAENVKGFPLLVRLSDSSFDFSQARADGSDIRFTKCDNVSLPFEVERWDAAAHQAEIWVKIDTVYGNDSSQFFVIYWGEAALEIAINHAGVFDTAGGFRGVWHLSEEAAGVGAKGLYKDAVGLCNGDDYISSTDRSGIIGYGHAFNGIDDFIALNSPVTDFLKGDLTISLWVNILDSGGTILSKLDSTAGWNEGESSLYFGDGSNIYHTAGHNGMRPSFVGYSDDYAIASGAVVNDCWSHLVYTWKWNGDSTGTARYYIDGSEISPSRDSLVIRTGENKNATVRIGQPNSNESYSYFKGHMDELEISAVVRSADWIKLAFLNQGKDNLLVKF